MFLHCGCMIRGMYSRYMWCRQGVVMVVVAVVVEVVGYDGAQVGLVEAEVASFCLGR